MPLEQGSHLIYSANICAWQLNKSPHKWEVLGALLELSVFYLGAVLGMGQLHLRCRAVSVLGARVCHGAGGFRSRERGDAGVELCLQWDWPLLLLKAA